MTVFPSRPRRASSSRMRPDDHVDPADHPVIALDHLLVLFRGVEPPAPARPAHRVLQEGGLGVVVLRRRHFGDGDVDVPVEAVHGRRPEILLGIAVVGVGRPGAPEQAEGPPGFDAAEEIDDLFAFDLGHVALDPVDRLDVGEAVEISEVEHLGVDALFHGHAELADESRPVPGPAEADREADVREGRGQRRLGEGVGVRPFIRSGQDAGPAGGADRGGHEGAIEPNALAGQPVDVRRPDDRVAGAAERVETLIVGQDEKEIRAARRSLTGAAPPGRRPGPRDRRRRRRGTPGG